mmetsp:Transcript_13347/g.11844  ORF Transcript_13347/g.11844 Transcript_13347/m.11844 type:complete len:106 (-) Transcript_13347:19-336(-)
MTQRENQIENEDFHNHNESALNKYSVVHERRKSEISSRIIEENKNISQDDKMESVLNILKYNNNSNKDEMENFHGYDAFHFKRHDDSISKQKKLEVFQPKKNKKL